jgi:hypothetical protein
MCRSKHKFASYEKSKRDTDLALTESTSTAEFELESFLFSVIHSDPIPDSTPDSVIMVNVAWANPSANYWILDTGATNHVTGNRHLFESFHLMRNGTAVRDLSRAGKHPHYVVGSPRALNL